MAKIRSFLNHITADNLEAVMVADQANVQAKYLQKLMLLQQQHDRLTLLKASSSAQIKPARLTQPRAN
ncbi:MAG: hypothetical protein ACI9IO_000964 [Cyanobium sp.]